MSTICTARLAVLLCVQLSCFSVAEDEGHGSTPEFSTQSSQVRLSSSRRRATSTRNSRLVLYSYIESDSGEWGKKDFTKEEFLRRNQHPYYSCMPVPDVFKLKPTYPGSLLNLKNPFNQINETKKITTHPQVKDYVIKLKALYSNVDYYTRSPSGVALTELQELLADTESDSSGAKKSGKSYEELKAELETLVKENPEEIKKHNAYWTKKFKKQYFGLSKKITEAAGSSTDRAIECLSEKYKAELKEVKDMRSYWQKSKQPPEGFDSQYLISHQLEYDLRLAQNHFMFRKGGASVTGPSPEKINGIKVGLAHSVDEADARFRKGYQAILGGQE